MTIAEIHHPSCPIRHGAEGFCPCPPTLEEPMNEDTTPAAAAGRTAENDAPRESQVCTCGAWDDRDLAHAPNCGTYDTPTSEAATDLTLDLTAAAIHITEASDTIWTHEGATAENITRLRHLTAMWEDLTGVHGLEAINLAREIAAHPRHITAAAVPF